MSENNNQEQQLTKKERKEQERIKKQRDRERRIIAKKIKTAAIWLVSIAVLVGLFYWFVQTVEKNNANRPGEAVAIMGTEHLPAGQSAESYNSNPPTSGSHSSAVPWGVSSDEIPDMNAIHNLEHGGIWITYKNLDEESISALEAIGARNSLSVIVSPREANDANIAVVSWGRIMKLDAVDEARITEFIRKNKNKSPERLAR